MAGFIGAVLLACSGKITYPWILSTASEKH